jgi:hypothetical protein
MHTLSNSGNPLKWQSRAKLNYENSGERVETKREWSKSYLYDMIER